MAISIKDPNLDPGKILKVFGWGSVADQLISNGIQVLVSPLALKFVHKGKVVTGVTGKPIVWGQAVKGHLEPDAKNLYEDALDKAIYEVVEFLKKKGKIITGVGEGPSLDIPEEVGKSHLTAMELLTGKIPDPKPEEIKSMSGTVLKKKLGTYKEKVYSAPSIPKIPQAAIPGWPYVSESAMVHETPKSLATAHAMYQPVKTTSKEKRYFLVAGNEHIRVAARYHSKTLSIRVEGSMLTAYGPVLHEAGLGDDKGGYFSIHVSCADRMEAQKALGAAIAGVGIMDTPMPDMAIIEGKG